jgi:hypothetical protein
LVFIDFIPNPNIDLRFNYSVQSFVSFNATFIYYSRFALFLMKFMPYLCFTTVFIAFCVFLFGIFAHRLAGLEAVIVIQFAYITILWLDYPLYKPLSKTYPLKFSTGINPILFNTNST